MLVLSLSRCTDSNESVSALKLLGSKPDVMVLDLNAAVSTVCGKPYKTCNLQRWQNVHFTTAGKQFCAVQVAHAIAPMLAPGWHKTCTACTGNDTGINNMRCKCKVPWKAARFPWQVHTCKGGLPPLSPAGGGTCSAMNGTAFRCGAKTPKSCELLSASCPDYAACCEMCIKHRGCKYWTHTMQNDKPTCSLKANVSDIDVYISGGSVSGSVNCPVGTWWSGTWCVPRTGNGIAAASTGE